jgi:hypothetical protein
VHLTTPHNEKRHRPPGQNRDMSVSTMLRDWILPTLQDRDEQFAAEWQRRMTRIAY